ncbi:hypothetical protein Btru_057172 [Bulinus truncatus]|nr:hypothetical protein Btru_057172 [Bulinus truncatus]
MLEKIKGGRDKASKIIILVTDGKSNDPDKTKKSADNLKKQNVQILTVGVGNADSAELTALASSKSNVFYVKDFNAIDRIASEVSDRACQASTDAPPFIPPITDECDYEDYGEYQE